MDCVRLVAHLHRVSQIQYLNHSNCQDKCNEDCSHTATGTLSRKRTTRKRFILEITPGAIPFRNISRLSQRKLCLLCQGTLSEKRAFYLCLEAKFFRGWVGWVGARWRMPCWKVWRVNWGFFDLQGSCRAGLASEVPRTLCMPPFSASDFHQNQSSAH